MLQLNKIEEGACYVTDTTKLYVAWSMLYYSSKLFWGCVIIKSLDQVISLHNRAFGDKPEAFSELIDLFKNIESSVLDAVRIMICFENYFKAKMLLGGYVIHRMDLEPCKKYPQFVVGDEKKKLLQNTTPIMINEVKKAEKWDENEEVKSLDTLTDKTIGLRMLLDGIKYRPLFLREQAPDDQRLLSILNNLYDTRNTLHFLSIDYVASGMPVDDFVFLRDYVTNHIDTLGNMIKEENEFELEIGKSEIDHLLDLLFDANYNDEEP